MQWYSEIRFAAFTGSALYFLASRLMASSSEGNSPVRLLSSLNTPSQISKRSRSSVSVWFLLGPNFLSGSGSVEAPAFLFGDPVWPLLGPLRPTFLSTGTNGASLSIQRCSLSQREGLAMKTGPCFQISQFFHLSTPSRIELTS